jgi:hypothetical protein
MSLKEQMASMVFKQFVRVAELPTQQLLKEFN